MRSGLGTRAILSSGGMHFAVKLRGSIVSLVLAAAACAGCRLVDAPADSKSLLAAAQASPDSIGLEIISVRFPQGREDINVGLWSSVDELHFPAETRRQLQENG